MATTNQTQTQQMPSIPREFLDKFGEIVRDILMLSQELAFELSTIECPNAQNCEVCKKAKEIIVKVKELIKISKQLPKT